MESITDSPLYALEEQLARQKAILANKNLVKKLPDKGAKVQDAALILEAEIRRRKESATKPTPSIPVKDVGSIEWTLLGPGGSSSVKPSLKELDSDDDDEINCDEGERALEIVATSQISQRQTKPTFENNCDCDNSVDSGGTGEGFDDDAAGGEESDLQSKVVKLDKYVTRLVTVDSKKPIKDKYVPGKTLKSHVVKSEEDSEMRTTESSSSSKQSSRTSTPIKSKSDAKYAECLLPPSHRLLGPVKLLSLDEGIVVSEEKYKAEEALAAASTSVPRKKYAYDKLKEEGLLGTYSVEMQVTRPVRTDADEDDLEEEDLSDDEITEESDSEASDDDRKKDKTKANQKTSKDLSNLLNANLKLK